MHMHNNAIVFIINAQERIRVVLPCAEVMTFRYSHIKVVYIKDTLCEQAIYEGVIHIFIDALDSALKAVCSENFRVNRWVQKYRMYRHNPYPTVFAEENESEPLPYFVGQRYIVCKTKTVVAWLYEYRKEYFFEIAPVYKFAGKIVDKNLLSAVKSNAQQNVTGEATLLNRHMNDDKLGSASTATVLNREAIGKWFERIKYMRALIEFNDGACILEHEERERDYMLSVEVCKKKDVVEKKRVTFQPFIFFNNKDDDEEGD